MRDYSRLEHITPMKQQFIDARRIDNGVLISRKHRNSDEVLLITQGTKNIIPEKGFYCSAHGGFLYEPCPCENEKRILDMWCDHGKVPSGGCKLCFNENPRNWDPPMFNDRVVAWSEATRALQHRGSLPHTSSGNSRDFSKDTVTATKVLPELSWKGTLGKPPKEFANDNKTYAKKTD